ncbi:Ig-like domain-containing protein [Domibacillus sp. PGB-M46]|uniref:RCC1 domain-containing protein n=1 Tax=Domibacillus sp. PGB-M46 TaxID=2910255 RepID=UPI001F56F02A|nr:Ig-like domain-containing protein [Domibacillus sp. PGB-M46]MCI2253885.1 Ig-like domain-containing protein [Domibacillus sp. PGB-M46]
MAAWIKRKYNILIVLLLLPVFLFSSYTAEAYGPIHHEKVMEAGKGHFVVLKEDGSVWSWGDNQYGQMGAQTLPALNFAAPLQVKKPDGNRFLNAKSVAAGGHHTVVLDADGLVWTWGRNDEGQLGHSSFAYRDANPKAVGGLPAIIAIAAGDQHTLAVDEQGNVWAWGRNAYGQAGKDAMTGNVPKPEKVAGITDVVAVAAGAEHSVALKRDGTVWAWGRNTTGQLGNSETKDVNSRPQQVPGLIGITEIAAGDNHTLALKQDRTAVWAWGSNSYGQLGDGGKEMKLMPIQVQGMKGVTEVSAGDNHTAVLKEDGTVWTWGRNTSGIGTSRSTPIQVKGVENAVALGGGGGSDSFTIAAREDGTVWLWNKASSDPNTNLPVFKQVHGISNVKKASAFPFVQGSQVLFRYFGDSSTGSVKVSGSFNDWVDLPLEEVSPNVWELQVTMKPGDYNYGFMVNGIWTTDPLNRNKTINEFGSSFSVLNVPIYATEGPVIDGKTVTFSYSSHDQPHSLLELDARTEYVAVAGNFSGWDEIPLEKQPNNTWTLTKTLEPGEYYYSFIVRDAGTSPYNEKRNDPLNPNLKTDSVTGDSRNQFAISALLPLKVPVTGVSLNKGPDLPLIVGEQEYVKAVVSPSNATNKNVNWSSSKPSVANIDETGKITAVSNGTAVIICATEDGGKTATVTVKVSDSGGINISYPKAGYREFKPPLGELPTGVIPNKVWKVKFNQPLNKATLHSENVYVMNQSGVKVPISIWPSADGRTIEIRLADGFRYAAGASYYIFIEKGVQTTTGSALKEPIQMKFTIGL